MAVRLTVLGSGSGGNCTYLETDETRILIDAGFSGRQIRKRLEQIGRAPESLQAILITHEHTDHICGLGTLGAKLKIPVYCNRFTQEALQRHFDASIECRLFMTGGTFEIGDLVIETFPVPHDAQDPTGFFIRTPDANFGVLTDLGHATKLVVERVRKSSVLLLEANHDIKMLQEDHRRPWSVKQRILGRHGHLCNDAAAEVAAEIVTSELRHLYLGHLSQDCNRPELALGAVMGRLQQIGANHVQVESTSQDVPCPTLVFGIPPVPCALPAAPLCQAPV